MRRDVYSSTLEDKSNGKSDAEGIDTTKGIKKSYLEGSSLENGYTHLDDSCEHSGSYADLRHFISSSSHCTPSFYSPLSYVGLRRRRLLRYSDTIYWLPASSYIAFRGPQRSLISNNQCQNLFSNIRRTNSGYAESLTVSARCYDLPHGLRGIACSESMSRYMICFLIILDSRVV
ncbi:hypothetical protein BJ912DRAFT_1048170 [Pholiota molesta]|nr:hypothetical protein BJ912DRAFT_1048170 [Pholiota molesta]